jgi:hypothetical protein
MVSRGSAVNIATAYGLDDRGVGVRVLLWSEFSLLHIVQTRSGALPAFYPMGTVGSFPGRKAAGERMLTTHSLMAIKQRINFALRLRCHKEKLKRLQNDSLWSLLRYDCRCWGMTTMFASHALTPPRGKAAEPPVNPPSRSYSNKLIRGMYINFLYIMVYFSNISNGSRSILT